MSGSVKTRNSRNTRARARSIPGGEEVYDALVGLLARSGLEYSGDFVEIDGASFHYLDYGPRDGRPSSNDVGNGAQETDQPPIVLMHGAGPGAGVWYRQLAILRERRRVVAVDGPMFGLSDMADIDEHPTSLGARFLLKFLDAMGIEQADLVGLSLGGAVVLSLAIDHPGRVRRLVLIDSAGLGRDIPFAWRLVHAPWIGSLILRPTRRLRDRVFERWEVRKPDLPDAGAYSAYSLAVRRRPGRVRPIKAGLKRFTSWLGQRRRFSNNQLGSVASQTLVLWGDSDRVFPVGHGERAAALIPDADLQVLPDAGHVCFWDQPEMANRLLIEFLNSH
ncbi:MAG: alpha/beta fold hydrolase [Chloroflexi bacterium]|nr:alpha/beta fold hydrolase [Chloroflexota bacterium]